MSTTSRFAEIAALAGDPARAGMLHALLDGRALTATELARAAGITPQTASGHLSQLTRAGLLAVQQQGRHRYHRLATPAVARMLESIMQVAAAGDWRPRSVSLGPRDAALRTARTCYDHLAGRLGVALADSLVAAGHVELSDDAGLLTATGHALLTDVGIDLADATSRSRRLLCRPCLDWSERRPHLAGVLGATICAHALRANWIRRVDGTRAVAITPAGRRQLRDKLAVTID